MLIQSIPKSFNKFFNGTTPCKVTLKDQDRNPWNICLEKIDDRLVFKNGWRQFARDKCLEERDFLVFEYDGKSTFYVKIFSKSGCRIEAENLGKTVPIVILEENSAQNCTKVQRGYKRKHPPTPSKINDNKSDSEGPSPSQRKPKRTYEENGNHVERKALGPSRRKPKRIYEENGNHVEKKALGPAKCVPPKNTHFEEVPRRILKQLNINQISKISLRDENNKLWPVAISKKQQGRHFFADGWYDFRQAHNIKEGHRCDFQFVIGKANVVKELRVRVLPPSKSKCP
ncbi:DNA-binding barrel domain superfamily [Sesbania bispinosa]|nr:DNA-binding barrel domain superfamily [Sesbania bispinosa]